MKMRNKNMNDAKLSKDDEFYTRTSDVAAEISDHDDYILQFKNKTVICNCNDSELSGFFKFFSAATIFLDQLQLKRLISISYNADGTPAKVIDIDSGFNRTEWMLKGNGDFKSEECVELLNQADIVCTNPPFSVFRDFISLIVKHDKKFLVIGNIGVCSTNSLFKLFKDSQMWFGYNHANTFDRQHQGEEGSVGAAWYTNLDIRRRSIRLQTTSLNSYRFYDNYPKAIDSSTKNIPNNYYGEVGVPISFLLKHNPDQFDLIGTSGELAKSITLPNGECKEKPGRFYIDGRRLFDRIVIRRREAMV